MFAFNMKDQQTDDSLIYAANSRYLPTMTG